MANLKWLLLVLFIPALVGAYFAWPRESSIVYEPPATEEAIDKNFRDFNEAIPTLTVQNVQWQEGRNLSITLKFTRNPNGNPLPTLNPTVELAGRQGKLDRDYYDPDPKETGVLRKVTFWNVQDTKANVLKITLHGNGLGTMSPHPIPSHEYNIRVTIPPRPN